MPPEFRKYDLVPLDCKPPARESIELPGGKFYTIEWTPARLAQYRLAVMKYDYPRNT